MSPRPCAAVKTIRGGGQGGSGFRGGGSGVRGSGLGTGPGEAQQVQGGAPFDVAVWDVEFGVQAPEAGVELFVGFVLPLGAGGVAEEHAAAEGADGVDAAKLSDLKRAAGAIPGSRRCVGAG